MLSQRPMLYKRHLWRLPLLLLGLCILLLPGAARGADGDGATPRLPTDPTTPLADPVSVAPAPYHGEWTLHNNTIVWSYSGGDIGTYFSGLRAKSVNGGDTQLLQDVDGQHHIIDIQADNVAYFSWDDVTNKIEKRMRADPFLNPIELFSFPDTRMPLDFVIDDTTGPDGRIYWSASDKRINWVDKYGNNSSILWTFTAAVNDLAVDEYHIWAATGNGVYRFDHNCPGGCEPVRVQSADSTFVYGASTGPLNGDQAVFFITNTTPPRVESWDCNLPGGGSGCTHKTLYTPVNATTQVYGVIATPDHVWWTEGTPSRDSYQLRRVSRNGGDFEIMALLDGYASYGGALALDDQYIYFRHNGISRISLDSTPIVFDFGILAGELTQGIQNIYDDVVLQERKPTWLHLYVRQTDGPAVGRVEVQVAATRSGVSLAGSPLKTFGVLTPADADLAQPRQDVPRITLQLPAEWTTIGNTQLAITIDPRRIYDQTPASVTRAGIFEWQPPICIRAIRVKVHGPDIDLDDPNLPWAVGMAERLLPARDIRLYFDYEPLEEGLWPFYSPYELPSDDWKVMANLWWRDRFSDDPDSCDNDDARTLYLGGYDVDFDPGFNGMAAVSLDQLQVRMPEMVSVWPLPYRTATLAHEIGHNYGREHVDCGDDPDDIDPNYPYESCWFGENDGAATMYGYYAGADRLIHFDEAADLMSYGWPRWPSDYTWNRIESSIEDGRAPQALRAPDANAVYVTGWVDTAANTGGIDPLFTLPSAALSRDMARKWAASLAQPFDPAVVRAGDVAYTLRFIGAGGSVLATYAVELQRLDARLTAPLRPFAMTVNAPAQPYLAVRLYADSTQLASRSGLGVPVVTLAQPVGGSVVSGALDVAWSASDTFSSGLTFIVQYSPDDGASWFTLANGISGPAALTSYSVSYAAQSVPGSVVNQARVRVLASDGFITSSALSAGFTLLQRPPNPYIEQPAHGAHYAAGQVVALAGGATDPEDDTLTGSNLLWRLNGVSYGNGEQRTAAGLAPGSYSATLTATDSGLAYAAVNDPARALLSPPANTRASAAASATFSVDPVEVVAGSAVLDGVCSDGAYAASDALPLKPYSDGSFGYALLMRSDRYLWICFDGLRKQGVGSPGAFVGVRVDGNLSRDSWAQTTDYGFFIRQSNGTLFATQGNGAGGFGDAASGYVSSAFDGRLSDRGTAWSAELRIDLDFMRDSLAWGDSVGIDFGHYWVDAQGNDFHWPHAAVYNRPNTWATTQLRRVPTLTTISPTSVTLGVSKLTLALYGEGLQAGDRAYFSGTLLTTTFVSSTKLTASVPIGLLTAGVHPVTLRSAESDNVASPPLPFTVNNRVPIVTALTPNAGYVTPPARAPLLLTVTGSRFVNGATIEFDGVPLATTFVSSTQLTATVPDALRATPRTVRVVVYNPSPTDGTSVPISFTLLPLPPTSVGAVAVGTAPATQLALITLAALLLLALTAAAIRRRGR